MHIETRLVFTWTEDSQVFLNLTDTTDSGLKHSFDKDALLRVDHLIVAFFKLTIDIYVLNVETG